MAILGEKRARTARGTNLSKPSQIIFRATKKLELCWPLAILFVAICSGVTRKEERKPVGITETLLKPASLSSRSITTGDMFHISVRESVRVFFIKLNGKDSKNADVCVGS